MPDTNPREVGFGQDPPKLYQSSLLKAHQGISHVRASTSDRGRPLRRKNHLSLALSTIFKRGHAPRSTRNTLNSSRPATNHAANPELSKEGLPIWPPDGLTQRSHLTYEDAESLISRGALVFQGYVSQALHTRRQHNRYFAFAGTTDADYRSAHYDERRGLSLVLGGYVDENEPWDTLEQPSMTQCFGSIPGSITLNRFFGAINRPLADELSYSLIIAREMGLRDILDRLETLQQNLDEDVGSEQEYIYNHLIFDCRTDLSQPPDVEDQIYDLAAALDSPRWFDFRQTQNQLIASLFSNDDPAVAHIFFHQLMLSMQLLLNIRESGLRRNHRVALFSELPEQVAWSVALAQIWDENCALVKSKYEDEISLLGPYRLVFRNQKRHVGRLKQFARSLEWPRLSNVEESLKDSSLGLLLLQERSVEVKTWLSGLVLPGTCTTWMIMAALVACDKRAAKSLKNFTLFVPNFGFQYQSSSYWYWECIVAKVMAPAEGVNQSTGWVGPVYYSVDLANNQCVLINQYNPPRGPNRRIVRTMESRSSVLGSPLDYYPVRRYSLPHVKTKIIDTISFQRLEFKAASLDPATNNTIYDSYATFTVAGYHSHRLPVRLRYNVNFIAAPPCDSAGPHVLCYEYDYRTVRADEIWRINFWGGGCVCRLDRKGPQKCKHRIAYPSSFAQERVLVIRAFGKADNVVFARAWCSYMGLSAVVMDLGRTCVACAIRNAYAACVYVVVVSGGKEMKEEEEAEEAEGEDEEEEERRHRRSSPMRWRRDRSRSAMDRRRRRR